MPPWGETTTGIIMITEDSTRRLIEDVYNLKDLALYNANKYRWDPTFSRMHNEYLNELDEIIGRLQQSYKEAM